MKTLYKILTTGILITIFGLFAQSNVLAVDNLVVEFQNIPLFNEANFNPGTSADKWIKVTNNSGSTQNIAIEAINHPIPIPEFDLSRALNIVIKQGSTDLYGGTLGSKTLYDFYNAGEALLSSLASGATTQYDIVITFPEDKTDEWQTRTTGFDILIGFQGTEGGSSSGGGSGGYIPPQGLVILNDQVSLIDVGQTTATFVWDTSHFSTSQIIYGSNAEAHTLNLSDTGDTPPKYGYAHTTSEFDVTPKVTHHSVIVTGLIPNTTYYFRAVSHGSLAISGERTFKTAEATTINIGNIEIGETIGGEVAGQSTSSQQGNENQTGGETNEGVIPPGQNEEGTTITTSTAPTFVASVGNIMSFIGDRAWLIIILILIFIGIVYFLIWFFILKKKKHKKEPPQQPFISKPVG